MWFMYEGTSEFIALTPERVKEIIELNITKVRPSDLKDFSKEVIIVNEPDYSNVVGQDSLNRFDTNFNRKKGKKPNKPVNSPSQERRPMNNATIGKEVVESVLKSSDSIAGSVTEDPENKVVRKNKRRKPIRRNPNQSVPNAPESN